MHSNHELYYDQVGNPFLLQWHEFFQWHGRLITHIPARFTLQWGYPYFYIIKSLIIFLLFFLILNTISPKFWKENNYYQNLLLFSIFLVINALLPVTTFMMYYGTDLLFIYSYYVSCIFILLFLQYYINILYNQVDINTSLFYLLAFITGASFEMSIACIPFIISIYILLKIQKISIPKWFWWSIPFFFLGFSILIFAPGLNNRLLTLENHQQWDFFGQTINWLDLGYKRYLYSLVRNIFYSAHWFATPGFLPYTWYIQILILIFSIFNFKTYKSIFNIKILLPLLYWLFSWYTCIVMSSSPTYHRMTLEVSMFFMYISLISSIYYYFQYKSKKLQIILISIFLSIVFIGQGIQIQPLLKAKYEYLSLIKKIEKGEITELSYDQFPKAKIGNITIIEFGKQGIPIKYPHLKIIKK